MTVIAAVATDTQVYMACDTRTDYSGTGIMTVEAKISTLRTGNGEKVLIGASGHAALRHVALRGLSVGSTPDPADHAAADAWADALAVAITDGAVTASPPVVHPPGEHGGGHLDGMLLLAWRHHLWWISTHASKRPHHAYMAIGSGTEVALGSLAVADFAGLNADTAVDLAVRNACRHASGCGIDERGPIIHTTLG